MQYTKIDINSYLYKLLQQIPEGYVTTYGILAEALGDKRVARSVGYMLSINDKPDVFPCYKVVYSDGRSGKYALGSEEKIRRLTGDGIGINNGKIENFENKVFKDFKTDYPLRELQKEQIKIASMADFNEHPVPEKIAAIDVSYCNDYGYASMVFSGSDDVRGYVAKVKFPYMSSYLAYRELPFIEKIAQDFDGLILIDANGLLHPREAGLATFAGVIMNKHTIGVAKSLLFGNIRNSYIYYNNKPLGYEINKRTIVSPGNFMSLQQSINIIKNIGNNKYPKLLKRAHDETVKLRNAEIAEIGQR